MAECRRCLLPEGKFGVVLDGKQICNLCSYYEDRKAMLENYDALGLRLKNRLEKLRGKYEYDALVGLSGGKDSAYVLYKLVREYELKVLVVTYENGFLTDFAKRNVESIVKKLGVDHFFHRPDWDVHKFFYKAALHKLGDPCVACAIAGYFMAIKRCFERKIPFFVHGRSPYQMLRNLYDGSRDVFIPLMMINFQDHSFEMLHQLFTQVDKQVRGWMSQLFDSDEEREAVYREFFLDPNQLTMDFVPELLGFFLFEPYDEDVIRETIEREVGYERPKDTSLLSHADCQIHDVSVRLFKQVHGVSMLMPEVAVMLRRGVITREEAKKMIAGAEPVEDQLKESIKSLCEKLDLEQSTFGNLAEQLKRNIQGKFDSH